METALSFLGGLSPILQVILIALLAVVFKDDIARFFRRKTDEIVGEGETADWRELLLGQMQELSLHFNHQTTEGQNRLEEKLEKSLSHQEKMANTLQELKEYGVKCRKD